MKKKLLLLIFVTVLILSGCGKKEQMTNFIPTAMPSEDVSKAITPTGSAATPTPKTVYVGQTTTKYVNLKKYNDVLNVRTAPSTDSDVVGFLVHTEKIEVVEIKDGWASFVYDDVICYVNADFLSDKKPDYIDPPTPTVAPTHSDKSSSSKSGQDI